VVRGYVAGISGQRRAPAGTIPKSATGARRAAGRELRHQVPRSSHGAWVPAPDRADPLALLEAQNATRVADLVPLRWARMAASPFAFLRGAAVVMAADLAATPSTGISVQVCGDAHIANFGVFASPERDLLFDVTDFDETARGPWEWDLKRLAASAVVAARDAKLNDFAGQAAAATGVRAYRLAMRGYARRSALATWYAHVDEDTTRVLQRSRSRRELDDLFASAKEQTSATALPALATLTRAGEWEIVDHPPVVSHAGVDEHAASVRRLFAGYRDTLEDDRRLLLDRFELRDLAMKVVGVGSVGTRCYVALLVSDVGEPLFLQVKEAEASALAPYLPAGAPVEPGRRVVTGQRVMQANSDIFLGWTRGDEGDFYVRQLRDMKGSADFATMRPGVLRDYLELCGLTLARAHARSGAAAEIAGYLGAGPVFDDALTRFAVAYADQTAADHRALRDAIDAGRITAAGA